MSRDRAILTYWPRYRRPSCYKRKPSTHQWTRHYIRLRFIKNNAAIFLYTPTCPTKTINIVHNNSKKSGGNDNIDPNIIQHAIPQIANQQTHVFSS